MTVDVEDDHDEPVHKREQTALYEEVWMTLKRCRLEFDLTPVDMAGVLEIIKLEMLNNAFDDMNEDENGDADSWKRT